MSSRQRIYTAAGELDVSFDAVDGGDVRCGEINQKAIDYANTHVGASTAARFATKGQPYVITADVNVCPKIPAPLTPGPCWIWDTLHYTDTADKKSVQIGSPQFSTPIDFWLPKTAGFHYCKVLSPARVVEWMYVDGLREFASLKSLQKKELN